MPSDGPSDVERRQLRSQQGKQGMEKFTEDVFFGLLEVVVLALPALLALLASSYQRDSTSFAALVGLATMAVAVGTFRGEWVTLDPPWPDAYADMVALRLVHYNVAVLAVAYGGALIDVTIGNGLVTTAAVLVLAILSVSALPSVVVALRRVQRLRRWLFDPPEPPHPPEP